MGFSLTSHHLLLICLMHMNIHLGFSTTSDQLYSPTTKNVSCTEHDLPACDVDCKIPLSYPKTYLINGKPLVAYHMNCVLQHAANTTVRDTKNSPCTMDISDAIADLYDVNSTIEFYLTIVATTNERTIRVVFENKQEINNKNLMTALLTMNIDIYWKDIALLGDAVDIRCLFLSEWRDEFMTGEPLYHECVELEDKHSHTLDADFNISRPIKGLSSIGSLLLAHQTVTYSTLSPVVLDHVWPRMAEVEFRGLILKSQLPHLPVAMPKLQALELVHGDLTHIPDFPWYNEDLKLPLNMSRTISSNNQYADSTGITVKKDVYRRVYTLNNNNIADLDNFTFSGYIQKIDLANNNISKIHGGLFAKVLGLQNIKLSFNFIESIPVDTLKGLSELRYVYLDNNKLKNIFSETFAGLDNLRKVYLQGNELSNLAGGTFKHLPQLEMIDASNNNIKFIADDLLENSFTSLTFINISRNSIDSIPGCMLLTRSPLVLDLSFNAVDFPAFLKRLTTTQTPTHLAYENRLSSSSMDNRFVPAFNKIIHLEYNNINAIDIRNLTKNELDLLLTFANFFHVRLHGNPLKCDCQIFEIFKRAHEALEMNQSDKKDRPFPLGTYFHDIKCAYPNDLAGLTVLEIPARSIRCPVVLEACPSPCTCFQRSLDMTVIVDCKGVGLTAMPFRVPKATDTLDLSHNEITIFNATVEYFPFLSELDLSNNKLSVFMESKSKMIGQSDISKERVIKLHSNQIQNMPTSLTEMSKDVRLTLRDNHFHCDCHSIWFHEWLSRKRTQVLDIEDVICATGKPLGQVLVYAEVDDFICEVSMALVSTLIAGFLCLIIVLLITSYIYRGEIKVLMYVKFNWHPFDRNEDFDALNKRYDVFVSYSSIDYEWVELLRARFENQEPPMTLCIHDRDFEVGNSILENIAESMKLSRRMILVLSREYLQSKWCMLEFRMAHSLVKQRSRYLVVVLLEDISEMDIDADLQLYLSTNTYLSAENKWFWDKLLYAMPPNPISSLMRKQKLKMIARENSIIVTKN